MRKLVRVAIIVALLITGCGWGQYGRGYQKHFTLLPIPVYNSRFENLGETGAFGETLTTHTSKGEFECFIWGRYIDLGGGLIAKPNCSGYR